MQNDDKLLIKRAEEAVLAADRQCCRKAIGFLDPREKRMLERELDKSTPPGVIVEFFGGYDAAEREMLICRPDFLSPDYEEAVSAIEITGRDISELSHRDYLGSLMGLGIKRENIGDIVPYDTEDKCVVFLRPAMRKFVIENLTKIGRKGVRVSARNLSDVIIPQRKTAPISAVVSSLRLDCVLSAMINASRARAAEMIHAEYVKVDFETEKNVSRILKGGELLSVRGYGRFRLSEIRGLTRKGRTSIIIDRYI